jgi:RNA polymerase subunit RPABC4/transcription elongation factor Spt4
MKYRDWIERENRFRIKILRDWPEARDNGLYRICQACGEICLCSEAACPNCGSANIVKVKLELAALLDGSRIRCKKRYQSLFDENG